MLSGVVLEGFRKALLQLVLLLVLVPFAGCTGPGLEPPGGDRGSADITPGNEGAQDAGALGDGDTSDDPARDDTPRNGDGPDGDAGDGDSGDGDGDGSPDNVGSDDDAGIDEPGPGHALFQGVWAVEQPFHALYEATVYELTPDGRLIEHETVTLGTQEKGFVTGTVASNADGTRCTFGGGWHSEGSLRLVIDGVCADDVPRDIALDFPDTDPALGLVPQVSVDGDPDWDHDGFGWSWRKCAMVEGCVQTF